MIFFLGAAVLLNFFRVQNLTTANPGGTPLIVTARLECIRMPQTVCDLRRPLPRPRFDALGDADRFEIFALIAKLGCAVQHKTENFSGFGAITFRLLMAGQNVGFADAVIGEEAVSCLGIRPILADEPNACPMTLPICVSILRNLLPSRAYLKPVSTSLSINPTFTL